MARGSVVLYYGSAFHGGGANQTTDRDRIGLGFAYTLGWPPRTQYLACPPELARTFSAELQALMGYVGHFPFLGGAGNLMCDSQGTEPAEALHDRAWRS